MSNVYLSTQASAIPQNPNHEVIRNFIRNEHKTVFQGERPLHSSFGKMPERGVVVLRDLYRNRPDFIKLDKETGYPEKYQRFAFQDELNAECKKEINALSKDFIELRAGQTWYDICFRFALNPKTGYRHNHHTAGLDDIEIHLEPRKVTGRPKIYTCEDRVNVVGTFDNVGGSAACACGGYKSLENSNTIIVRKGTHTVDHEYDIDTRCMVDIHFTSKETVVANWGGKNPKKLRRMFERWLSVYQGHIYGYLCSESRMEEEMMQDMAW
ncbi:hypothetical protein GR7B_00211 [Vibrio phage vB_VcorM_GR7B]|nr:hypothetical protein GR7B_00211 [Vibrio phage vB_VcorM_GR7B]